MATSFDMGLLGDLFGGGGETGLEGYLTPAQQQAMQRQGLLQAAMAIGQASGPSTTPRSLMQILSSGVAAGQQGYAEAQKNAITNLLTKQKMDEYKMAQEQRRRLEEIFGAQAPVAGMPMTPQQALAVPGGQAGPTVERAAMVGQVPEGPAMSQEDMQYNRYMQAAQMFAATDPAKSKAYMDQALLIKPKAEVTGDIFTAKDGRQYQRTKTGQFIPIPTGMEFAQETVGEPFKAADGKYYLRTKTGGFVLAEQGLAAKPVGQPQQVMGADGKPTLVQMYDDGTYKPVTGVSPLIPPEKIDTGGGVRFVNPYEVKPGTVFPKTLAPQVVGGAETGYYVVGGGGGRGAMPGAPAAQPAPAAAPSRRGPPMPGAAAPVAPAAAGPQPIIPGTGPKPTESYSKASKQLKDLRGSLTDYKNEISKDNWVLPKNVPLPFTDSGIPLPVGEDTATVAGKYNSLLMGVKNLYELGALTGPDMSIIERQLTNPASWAGLLTSKKAMNSQVKILEDMLNRAEENLSTSYRQPAPIAGSLNWNPVTKQWE